MVADMSKEFIHRSVLLDEAVAMLVQNPDGVFFDGTFGRGGHSRLILNSLSPLGRLFATDKDPQALAIGRGLEDADARFRIYPGSFADIGDALPAGQLLDGILLDLGVSSPQLDDASRGFSFMRDGPLDMRMDPEHGQSAADWINSAEETEIADVLYHLGEERHGRRMARAIIARRQETPFTQTLDLAEVIKEANPSWEKHKHPATRAFQAIRIHINQELADLERLLEASLKLLKPGGRMVVISFHSLEDRMVKRFIQKQERGDVPDGLPVTEDMIQRNMKRVGKALKASPAEIEENARARSAVMRIAERR